MTRDIVEDRVHPAVLVLLTLLTLSTLLSNSFLLLVTVSCQQLRRGVDHLAIINLSLNGVLASLLVMTPSLANLYGHTNSVGNFCESLGFFTSLLLFNSVITSLLITTERLVTGVCECNLSVGSTWYVSNYRRPTDFASRTP